MTTPAEKPGAHVVPETGADESGAEKSGAGKYKAAADSIRTFVGDHGGPGTAVVSYLGRAGARVVVVAGDGLFTDAVVPSVEIGEQVCGQAGVPVGSWTRETSGLMTLSGADRQRMAGTGR